MIIHDECIYVVVGTPVWEPYLHTCTQVLFPNKSNAAADQAPATQQKLQCR